jgi:hypothetical protein
VASKKQIPPPVSGPAERRPRLSGAPPTTKPIPRLRPPGDARPRLRFSFRFFKQERFFAFEGLQVSWFASIFERLQAMSGFYMEDFINPTLSSDMRFHTIRWGDMSNFTRAYFDWVSPDYLQAEDEYPFLQFSVSRGRGRVVGFIDENSVFQVIALDPKHNIQTAHGHEGRHDCQPVKSDYMDLRAQVDRALAALAGSDHPAAIEKAREHLTRACVGRPVDGKVWVLVELQESDADHLHGHLVARPGMSASGVFERGFISLLDEPNDS